MMKNTAKRIYLILILILLYAPIITLVVLSFNNSKTRAKWGGFTGKWYISLFQNPDIMNALYTTLIIAFCTDCNLDRNRSLSRDSGNETEDAHLYDGRNQHPDAQRRYRNRNFPDAALCCISFYPWIFHGTAGTHHIQYSLCNIECHAKIKADKKKNL